MSSVGGSARPPPPVGADVVVTSVRSRPELNGQVGGVVAHREDGAVMVEFAMGVLPLRPSNLMIVAGDELRIDPNDGCAYAAEDFRAFYGAQWEAAWEQAERVRPESAAPAPLPDRAPSPAPVSLSSRPLSQLAPSPLPGDPCGAAGPGSPAVSGIYAQPSQSAHTPPAAHPGGGPGALSGPGAQGRAFRSGWGAAAAPVHAAPAAVPRANGTGDTPPQPVPSALTREDTRLYNSVQHERPVNREDTRLYGAVEHEPPGPAAEADAGEGAAAAGPMPPPWQPPADRPLHSAASSGPAGGSARSQVNDVVVAHSLRQNTALNGRTGRVVAHRPDGSVVVDFGGGAVHPVRPSNIVPAPPAVGGAPETSSSGGAPTTSRENTALSIFMQRRQGAASTPTPPGQSPGPPLQSRPSPPPLPTPQLQAGPADVGWGELQSQLARQQGQIQQQQSLLQRQQQQLQDAQQALQQMSAQLQRLGRGDTQGQLQPPLPLQPAPGHAAATPPAAPAPAPAGQLVAGPPPAGQAALPPAAAAAAAAQRATGPQGLAYGVQRRTVSPPRPARALPGFIQLLEQDFAEGREPPAAASSRRPSAATADHSSARRT